MLRQHRSLVKALKAVYPDFEWQPLKFILEAGNRIPRSYWKSNRNLLRALERAEAKLEISKVGHASMCFSISRSE